METKIIYRTILLTIACLITKAGYSQNQQQGELVIPGSIADCPVDRALLGDQKAAFQCQEHYLKEPKPRRYWSQIAAENGGPIAQYTFALDLLSEKNPLEKKRAIYWLKKAAEQGDVDASRVLRDIRENPGAPIPLPPPNR
jgi:TPR repeat protein